MTTALAKAKEQKVIQAKAHLSVNQILFAEWLALPTSVRIPITQKDFAVQIDVSEWTLCEWKKLPEIWEYRDSLITTYAKELIPEAVAVLRKQMQSENSKVALDAARDILDRWAEPRKRINAIVSIVDMYNEYQAKGETTRE